MRSSRATPPNPQQQEFRGVDRLKRFLGFVIGETLAGRGDQIKSSRLANKSLIKAQTSIPAAIRSSEFRRAGCGHASPAISSKKGRTTNASSNSPRVAMYPSSGLVRSIHPGEGSPRPCLIATASSSFRSKGSSPELDYLCQSVTRDVTHAVTQIEGLIVTACGDRTLSQVLDLCTAGLHPSAAISSTAARSSVAISFASIGSSSRELAGAISGQNRTPAQPWRMSSSCRTGLPGPLSTSSAKAGPSTAGRPRKCRRAGTAQLRTCICRDVISSTSAPKRACCLP